MKFSYSWDESQFLKSALYDYYCGAQEQRRRLFLGAVLIAILGFLALKWVEQGVDLLDVALVALAGIWLSLRRRLLVRMFRRAFQRSGQSGLELSYTLNEEGLIAQVNDRPPQTYGWEEIQKVIRTEQGFLLYPGMLWLPLSALEGDYTPGEVAALMQRKVNTYQDKSQRSLSIN